MIRRDWELTGVISGHFGAPSGSVLPDFGFGWRTWRKTWLKMGNSCNFLKLVLNSILNGRDELK